MNRQQAINYLSSSGFSEEQINTIEQAFKQGSKTGHWIPLGNYDDYGIESSYKCSECSGIDTYPDDFCPDCGADMREVEE